jgi:hypothetical protein
MFDLVVDELQSGMIDKVSRLQGSKNSKSGFDMGDQEANVCAFLDSLFHGITCYSCIFVIDIFYVGPTVDRAPELHQVRYTRLKWKKIYKDYYAKYCEECNIDKVSYEKFVSIRRRRR